MGEPLRNGVTDRWDEQILKANYYISGYECVTPAPAAAPYPSLQLKANSLVFMS